MEIALLQQIISQEARAGGSSTSGVTSAYVTEGNFSAGSYQGYPAIGPHSIYVTDYRGCNPSTGGFTSQISELRTYMGNTDYAKCCFDYLCNAGGERNNTSQATIYGLNSGQRVHVGDEKSMGHEQPFMASNNDTSYGPIFIEAIFLRNRTTSSQTFSANHSGASYWASGYDGSGGYAFIYNNSALGSITNYSTQSLWSYTSSTTNTNRSFNITVPAGCTFVICSAHTMYYWTTFSNGGHWYYKSSWDWGSNFTSGNFIPDLRCTASMLSLRDRTELPSTTVAQPSSAGGNLSLLAIPKMAYNAYGDHP